MCVSFSIPNYLLDFFRVSSDIPGVFFPDFGSLCVVCLARGLSILLIYLKNSLFYF